jgi:hypothetical protein
MFFKTTLSAFAAGSLLAVAAQGAIVTETASFGPVAIGTPSFTLPIQKFDPALGNLVSVNFALSTTTTGNSLTFDNESGVSGTVNLQIGANVTAKTGVSLITTVTAQPLKSGSGGVAADNDGAADFLGTDSFTISGGGSASNAVLNTTSNYLTQFTQQGFPHTYLVTISNSPLTSVSTSGIVGPTSAASGTFSGTVNVTYTYALAPVPEAGGLFWGLSLCGIVAVLRPRVRRSGSVTA